MNIIAMSGPAPVDMPDGPTTRQTLAYLGDLAVDGIDTSVEVLAVLARAAGKVIGHSDLLTAVWGAAHAKDTQYLRVVVGQLRQKLEVEPARPTLIETEPGVGYRLRV